jgi:hypothetical protein
MLRRAEATGSEGSPRARAATPSRDRQASSPGGDAPAPSGSQSSSGSGDLPSSAATFAAPGGIVTDSGGIGLTHRVRSPLSPECGIPRSADAAETRAQRKTIGATLRVAFSTSVPAGGPVHGCKLRAGGSAC